MTDAADISYRPYDEMVHVGKDFSNPEVVEAYDARHRRFRNIDAEHDAIIQWLDMREDQTIADFGSGTGAFVLRVARCCSRVHAIDISQAMLDYAKRKAQTQGLANIFYHHAGFLTYVHADAPLDAVTSSMALHHLPDFWKQKALQKLHRMLKPGGQLYLADVVYDEKDCEANVSKWVKQVAAKMGPEMADDIVRHIRQEYSTFTWIMEGLIERAGFVIDRVEYAEGVLAKYYGTKVDRSPG